MNKMKHPACYLRLLLICVVFVYPAQCFSQTSILSLGTWNISSLSGELKAGGLYGTGDINTYGISNKITSTNYYAGIMVRSSSFIWNPSFLTIDIDGGYYPESNQDIYLVTPNIYNVINTSKLHFGATLFPKKPITLSSYLNFDNSYDSRENLTDIRTNSKGYGGTASYRNKYLPLNIAYNNNEWDSREILTGRNFYYLQKNFEGRVYRSFRKRDRHDLIYSHHDYLRKDYNLYNIRNISDNLELQDGFYLDSAGRSHFNSNIFGTVQKGNDSFRQFRLNENLFYQLPHNFSLNSNYGFDYLERDPDKLGQHSFSAILNHQLFESVHSGLLYEYNNASDIAYHEVNNKLGFDVSYTKRTFAKGVINVQYTYNRIFERRNSTDVLLNVLNEGYTISDRILIKRPYVDVSTIVVKDTSGVIIYQPGPDYIVNVIGNFVEIQRVPGGLIPDNSRIFLFYSATQPGSYKYDINTHYLGFNLSLFSQLLNMYYKTNRMDFANVHNADNLLLNYLSEDIYGTNFKYKGAQLGTEYDDYRSSLTPYHMIRYYFSWQGTYKRMLYSLNANWRDYKLPTEDRHRIYDDINGMFSYPVTRRSRFDVTVGYQTQEGRQINLDLFTFRTKFSTIIRQLTFVVGFDAYDRVYLENQKTNYMGGYVQLIKKFKY